MDRLFLDANILFSAAHKVDARVFRLWSLRDGLLYSSRYALEEARFNLEDENRQKRLKSLKSLIEKVQFVEAGTRDLPKGVQLPDKDAPILLAAIEAKSDYLLTGDLRHFGPYFGKRIEGVTVVRPSQYLRLRDQS